MNQNNLEQNKQVTVNPEQPEKDSPPNQAETQNTVSSQALSELKNQQPLSGQIKIIKRYGNRKLYDTEKSSYVVLKDIKKMIYSRENIRVIDNETQKDITVPTLIQIIFSAEKKSRISPPLSILHSVIRDGDGGFSSFLAKLGLFTPEVSANSPAEEEESTLTPKDSKVKKKKTEAVQSEEQQLAHLVNSDETKTVSSKETVPQLPGGLT